MQDEIIDELIEELPEKEYLDIKNHKFVGGIWLLFSTLLLLWTTQKLYKTARPSINDFYSIHLSVLYENLIIGVIGLFISNAIFNLKLVAINQLLFLKKMLFIFILAEGAGILYFIFYEFSINSILVIIIQQSEILIIIFFLTFLLINASLKSILSINIPNKNGYKNSVFIASLVLGIAPVILDYYLGYSILDNLINFLGL